VLVVRAGARIVQPRGVRPALPQPSGQRVPLPHLAPPEELSRPILQMAVPAVEIGPSGPIKPVIDGQVTSYFEWMGAGLYRVDERSGSMHGRSSW